MAEWDDRELCPDDGCVGVIGTGGTCGVCGRVSPNQGTVRRADTGTGGADAPAPGRASSDSETTRLPDVVDGEVTDAEVGAAGGDDWDQRTLCPDGGCTGVIATGGACSVCGRTASEIKADSAP